MLTHTDRIGRFDLYQGELNNLANIAARAKEKGLPFLIAGGHAVIAHGHARNTFDIDLVIPRPLKEAWLKLALSLGYSLYSERPTFLQFNPPDDTSMPLDLMLVGEETFNKLAAASVPAPSSVSEARVVSLLHLVALKCHAIKHGHSGRIVKDADDVINLVLANRLDPDDAALRELVLRHGTLEFYEKLRRASKAT
jgi:hypothetical protein